MGNSASATPCGTSCKYRVSNEVLNEADVAQLVEQLIRNQQVIGSSPIVGSRFQRTYALFRIPPDDPFAHLTETIQAFVDALALRRFAVYVSITVRLSDSILQSPIRSNRYCRCVPAR